MRLAAATLTLTAAAAAQILTPTAAAPAGLAAAQLEAASQLLTAETTSGRVLAASLLVARGGKIALHRGYGQLAPVAGARPVTPGTVFLLASITKPLTACALMQLVERGRVSLNDPAHLYLPGLQHRDIRVRDLLSHTSGLPDMLPENTALRRAHAPLSDFAARALTTPLLYPPGPDFRYQSMGTLLAGEIVERVSGLKLREFERREIFEPLGMKDSSLGLGGRSIEDTAWCQTAPGPDADRFGPNSPYWRDMGHPWGGMHSTTMDLAILLQTFLNGGVYNGRRVFSPATVAAMTRDQNTSLPGRSWGLGWGLATSPVWAYFGDLVSPRTFGHSGATGTVAWADPDSGLLCVILTTRPSGEDNGRLLRLVSNAVAASLRK
ncbi:MAG: beta-lactamase family protein [Bryobacterales bacterium]|nr:beta-lactamase family protein [Bryobacterales bacterium]